MRLELDDWHWINLIGRGWWGAEPPDKEDPLDLPVKWVRFTWEHICYETKEITTSLQNCQKNHMKVGRYCDIPYNFMIEEDGTVYEGRGWKNEASRPFRYWGLDRMCLDICYIGDFKNEETSPTFDQIRSGLSLIMYGIKENYISPQYHTIQYRDEMVPTYNTG